MSGQLAKEIKSYRETKANATRGSTKQYARYWLGVAWNPQTPADQQLAVEVKWTNNKQ